MTLFFTCLIIPIIASLVSLVRGDLGLIKHQQYKVDVTTVNEVLTSSKSYKPEVRDAVNKHAVDTLLRPQILTFTYRLCCIVFWVVSLFTYLRYYFIFIWVVNFMISPVDTKTKFILKHCFNILVFGFMVLSYFYMDITVTEMLIKIIH